MSRGQLRGDKNLSSTRALVLLNRDYFRISIHLSPARARDFAGMQGMKGRREISESRREM